MSTRAGYRVMDGPAATECQSMRLNIPVSTRPIIAVDPLGLAGRESA